MSKELVVITGASPGIGEAIAKAFSRLSYPLLLIARRVEKLQAMNLPNILCKNADVTCRKDLEKIILEAENQFGPAGCLINNAGVMFLGPAETQDPNEWEKMVNTNVMGVLNGIHVVLKKMIERQSGTIINISSIAGRKTFLNHAVYCSTKHAVHAMTEAIRQEAAPT